MNKCLVCFKALNGNETGDYHRACAASLFDGGSAPLTAIDLSRLEESGLALLGLGRGIPGVQVKLSADRDQADPHRLTLVGYHGRYILKPPVTDYPALPENEAFCMHLAKLMGIAVAPHGLVRCQNGELAYISRRFDRLPDGQKLAQEDFCQLSQRPSADKYKGSLEAAAKVLSHSSQAGLDRVRFLELNLFCWLAGNADMHLKNFSLYEPRPGLWELSPAYDLVSTALVLPDDDEECALTLHGKKKRIAWEDWLALCRNLGIPEKVLTRLMMRFSKAQADMEELCHRSFLPVDHQEAFIGRWKERMGRVG